MTLRYLVPALGLAALTATTAYSAEMPSVVISGWSDNIVSFSDSDTNATGSDDSTLTAKDDGSGSLRFTAAASIKANWKIADRVDGKINLWFYPGAGTLLDDASTTTVNEASSNSNLNVREMYLAVDLTNGFSVQMGKYISHLGWLSAEPTGLYTVSSSMIGYTELYGNDVLGGAVIWHDSMRSPVSAQFHITNGYYTASDAVSPDYVSAPSAKRENTDLGFGLGLTYALPDDKGNIDFDLAYDLHSAQNGVATSMGGDAFMVGLNATLKLVPGLTLGAEVMHFIVDDSEAAPAPVVPAPTDGFNRTQALLLANYAFPNAPANMSATFMVQYITQELDTDPAGPAGNESLDELGISLALLTNPFTTTAFGVNGEIGFYDRSGIGYLSGPSTEEDGFAVSVELIGSF